MSAAVVKINSPLVQVFFGEYKLSPSTGLFLQTLMGDIQGSGIKKNHEH